MNEYIKREAAIEAVKHAWAKGLEPSQYIEIIPAADVAPVRHGRWIDKGEYAVCTECDGRSGTQYDGVEPIPLMTKFCSNCGAKMDGGADWMDVREKLVELLGNIYLPMMDGHNTIGEYNIPHKFKEKIADYLIRNGVTVQENMKMSDELLKQLKNAPITICKSESSIETVQEWISVKDRLPDNKEHDWVLAQVVEDNGYMHIPRVMEYRQQRNDWFEETYGWLSEHNGLFSVTHWMPLPEPPKDVKK